MREILFRGKHYRTGKWCYGIPFKNPLSGCEYAYYPQIIPEEHGAHQSIHRESVIEETIGQYTGMKDRNGVKVFEGDIIKTGANSKRLFIVFWSDKSLQFVKKDVHFDDGAEYGIPNLSMLEYEVVGNIYDNPELLEEDNDDER